MSIGSVGSLQGTMHAFELPASRARERARPQGGADVVVNPPDARTQKLGAPSTADTAATYGGWRTYAGSGPERLGAPVVNDGAPQPLGEPGPAPAGAPARLGAPKAAPPVAADPEALGAPDAAAARDARLLGAPVSASDDETRRLGAPTSADSNDAKMLGGPSPLPTAAPERLGDPAVDVTASLTRRLGGPIDFAPDPAVLPLGRPDGV